MNKNVNNSQVDESIALTKKRLDALHEPMEEVTKEFDDLQTEVRKDALFDHLL